jgi:phosphoglycerol transferase MdoB-like AlkP superfamily enzyme
VKYRPNTIPSKPSKEKIQQAHFVAGFALTFPFLYLYAFALIESKYSIFLQMQPFRVERYLSIPEKILFIVVFSAELLALLLGVAVILWLVYAKLLPKDRPRAGWLISSIVVFVYFVLVTAQFQVLRYFKDGLDMLLVRELGGGSVWSAVYYALSEFGPLILLLIAVLMSTGVLIAFSVRLISKIVDFTPAIGWMWSLLTPKRLLLLNLAVFLVAFAITLYFPILNKNLGYSLAHQAYTAPWQLITDFDFDGYSLVKRPVDHAPFDADRHPYAFEILGNAVDENGVGGDLEENIWNQPSIDWTDKDFSKQNILLIVLESARQDLHHARYNDEWVMPTLRSLPGHDLSIVAHTAFTAPAITSIFNGTLSRHEKGLSLIDHLNSLGYRTGVFSAQNEGFGNQDSATGLKRAGYFFDSRSISPDKRMHLSSSAIASAIPAREILAQFESWLRADDVQHFFAYINLQELHFPYSHATIEKPLLNNLISRYEINEKETDWLRETYYNAARVIDNAIAYLVDLLKKTGRFDNTVILVVGDHGEELFDFGSLGHGTDINFEQNSVIGKIINSAWTPDGRIPIGLSEVPKLIHNALVKQDHHTVPMRGSVLAFNGARKPIQIGLFTDKGLIKYDFRKDIWSRQSAYGVKEKPAVPDTGLIHLWESYVLSTSSSR